jgi:hypothetical protein
MKNILRFISLFSLIAIIAIGIYLGVKQQLKADVGGGAVLKVAVAPSTTVDESIPVTFTVDTKGKAISVVSVDVSYSDNLEYIQSSANSSDFSTTVSDPAPSNNHIKFERLRLDTGYTGSSGQILVVTFKATKAGPATITINKDQSVVAEYSDQPQNILTDVVNGSLTIQEKTITPPPSNPEPTPEPTPTPQPTPTVDKPVDTSTSTTSSSNAAATDNSSQTTKTTPAPKKTTPPVPAASAEKSTVTVLRDCVLADDKDLSIFRVTIKDKNGADLTSNTYKPTVTASKPEGIKMAEIHSEGALWKIAFKSAQESVTELTFLSNGVKLGTHTVTFSSSCATSSAATTSDVTTSTTDSATTVSTSDPATTTDSTTTTTDTNITPDQSIAQTPTTSTSRFAGVRKYVPYIVGGIILAGLLVAGALFILKRRSQNEGELIEPTDSAGSTDATPEEPVDQP